MIRRKGFSPFSHPYGYSSGRGYGGAYNSLEEWRRYVEATTEAKHVGGAAGRALVGGP